MLCFYAAGLCVVVGTWDYTRQAKAAGYDYSFDEYKLSVMDRYGAEAEIAFAVLDMVKATVMQGLVLVDETGVLKRVGLELPEPGTIPPDSTSGALSPVAAPLVLASAASVFAPETSLYPKARAVR